MLNGLLSSDVSGQLRGEVYFQSHSLKKKILHSITLIYYIMQLNRCIKNVCVCVGGTLLWICIFLVEPAVDTLGNFFF